ncbi:MGDG synthase family glycosyltransferase [Oceanivirga salmonicida]|uniref:MGDG synthase family glycosyltransferase n=1 Tax=Oceanivirga salmonicida TaxID=1769291 RepID=UPI00082E6CAC|nr:glycosyltransferase [Oceanivirga salmonicida]
MKYLILTASTGEGHNQAAKNLKNEFDKNTDDIAIIHDIFNNSKLPFVEKGYDFLIANMPNTYGVMYKLSNNKFLNNVLLKNIFLAIELNLKKIIKREKPDIIISTHPFAVPIVTRYKKMFNSDIPFIQIVTDFKAHYTYVDKRVNAYITASEFTKESLIKKGVSEDKIFPFGIPVKDEFKTINHSIDRKNNILIMGGSMGFKNMEKSILELTKSDLDIHITIVCGKNINLRKKLTQILRDEIIKGKIKILGFVNNISEIMDNSKIIITKPGGLTSSEAINKNLPMIIPFSIPGQEQENTAFLVESNVALEIKDISDLPNHLKFLLTNDEHYNMMVENMRKISSLHSIKAIIEVSKNYIK